MPAPCLAVAATGKTLCTVWPRTVMRGGLHKLTSGPDSVPKSARRPEPSPRNSRFAARPKGVAAQRRVWGESRGGKGTIRCPSPLLPPPPGGGIAHAMSWRTSPDPGGPSSPPAAHRCIGGSEGKEKGAAWPAGQAVSHAEKNLWSFFKKTLDFIVSIC